MTPGGRHSKGRTAIALLFCGLAFLALACNRKSHIPNPTGPKTTEGQDFNNDGKDDVVYHYVGREVVKVTSDLNFDGKFDLITFYAGGQPHHQEGDHNFDGEADAWTDFKFGNPESGRFDTDFNGKPDLFVTFKHGVPSETICRPNDQPVITRIYRYYDGILISEAWDGNRDGLLDTTNYYDAYGEVAGTESSLNKAVRFK